jgi:hypothetical protein
MLLQMLGAMPAACLDHYSRSFLPQAACYSWLDVCRPILMYPVRGHSSSSNNCLRHRHSQWDWAVWAAAMAITTAGAAQLPLPVGRVQKLARP